MSQRDDVWGTDGSISVPKPLTTTHTEMIDMDGFCFTPEGLRVNLSHADYEDLLRQGYGPSPLAERPHE